MTYRAERHFLLVIMIAVVIAWQSGPAFADTIVARNGDARLRVFSEGSGPAVVLLPGQGRGPEDFNILSKHLVSAGYRVVRPEPRGFGESVGPLENVFLRDLAADVAAAIDAAGVAPAIMVGWAYGNRVARMLASDKPQMVRGVVLLAAGGKFPAKPEVVATLRKSQDKNLPLEVRAEAARAVLYGPTSNLTALDMQLDNVSTDTIKAQSFAPQFGPLETWWDGGKAPMLVLQGLHDVIAPPENGRSLQRDHPERVTLVEFPELGHNITRERPDLVAAAIVDWAGKLGQ